MTRSFPPAGWVPGWFVLSLIILLFSLEYLPFSQHQKFLFLFIGIVGVVYLIASDAGLPRNASFGPATNRRMRFAWLMLLIMGAILRLYRVTTLSAWPILDEGQCGFYGLEIAHGQGLKAFYGIQQLPPLSIWLQGMIFRYFGASLRTLWLPQALISIAGMLTGMLAVRRSLKPTTALMAGGLIALGFWPNWSGRFAHWVSLGLFWEWTALWLLGVLISCVVRWKILVMATILGIWVGTGLFVMIPWPGTAIVVTVVVIWKFGWKRLDMPVIGIYMLGLLLEILPFIAIAVHENYGDYILNLFSLDRHYDWTRQLEAWSCYLSLPWLRQAHPNSYCPVWGGLFNPLSGAFLVVGLAVAWKRRRERPIQWLVGSTIFLMIPGLLTETLEAFRTVQAWPFLTVLAALGAESLVQNSRKWKGPLIAAFILSSGILDSYHLFVRYPATWGNLDLSIPIMKNSELTRAERILRTQTRHNGTGYLLLNFRPDSFDQTLTIAVDGYCRGPWDHTKDDKTFWTAALVNQHYRPFLARRFPKSQWYDLGSQLAWPYGYLALAIFPEGSVDRETLERWVGADRALQPLTSFLLNRRLNETDSMVLRKLARLYPNFKGDPFLESCYYEKAYLYFIRAGDNSGAEKALRRGLLRGYPAAHFYYQLGNLCRAMRRPREAASFFRCAVKAPGNRTNAARFLDEP